MRWIHRQAMRSITSVMPAMKDITAQAMNAISAITGPLEGAIGPTGSATQRPFAGRPRPTKARVRQRGGLLTRTPSRGRERQLERRGAMLNATCRLMVRQRSVAMDPWILDPQTAGETQNFLESTPLSFLRAGPPNFRRISAESRAHPNFDKKFAKLGPRPKYCSCSVGNWRLPFFLRQRYLTWETSV